VNLSFPQTLFAAIGALLIYSAVTGKMPATAIKGFMGQHATPKYSSGAQNVKKGNGVWPE
jgi:hypothetical protein